MTAVDGVDLDVAEGEVVAFLGPNGAGKTTTLRILTTLLKPTAGTATVAGYDVATQAEDVRRSIGYVSQSGSTGSVTRAGEEVVDHGMLYGMSAADARARGQHLFEQLDLEGLWTRQPRAMSGGQRRRLDIVMGLIHEPTLVFLDEPTTGLDPQARANLWQHIADLRAAARGDGVPHDPLPRRGRRAQRPDRHHRPRPDRRVRHRRQPQGRRRGRPRRARGRQRRAGEQRRAEARRAGRRRPTASRSTATRSAAACRQAGRAVPGLLRDLDRTGVELSSIEVRRPTLDDVFLDLTGRSLREG